MISGASSEELDIANARADIILALDNTATYESWLYIDSYIDKLEHENIKLKLKINNVICLLDNPTFNNFTDYKEYRDKIIKVINCKDE